MTQFNLETSWDVTPTSASTYEIYDPDDQFISGNNTDETKKYDGTDFTALEGDAPKGNIIFVYKDRLMVTGDSTKPHRIWFSHIRNGEGWTQSGDWIEIRPQDGGKVNSVSIQNDEAIISKDNGRKYGWRIYDDGDPTNSRLRIIEDDKGSVSKKAETVMEDVLYYLDRNAIFTVPRGNKGGLSFIVDEVIKSIDPTVLASRALGSNDGKVYISLGDITIDSEEGITLTDAIFVYDSVNGMFFIRDNTNVNIFTRFIDSDNDERLYFGDQSGRVFKMDEGTLAGENTVHMRIRTKQYLRELGKMITVNRIGVFMGEPDGTNVLYRTDEKQFFHNLGQVISEPVQWFAVKKAKGPFIQLEFTHSNPDTRPVLNGFEIQYHIEGEEKDGK